MSPLIRIFTVCLVNLIFIPIVQKWKKQGLCPNLDDCPNLPDFTLVLGAQKNLLRRFFWVPTTYVFVEK